MPRSLRCRVDAADVIDIRESMFATCFPGGETDGATGNRELYAAEGEAMGKEGAAKEASVVLGPGCNFKRNENAGHGDGEYHGQGLLHMENGHYIKGIIAMPKKVKREIPL